MTELIKVEGLIEINKSDVVATFCDNEKLSGYVKIIADEVAADEVNLSTDKGRKAIGSRAFKVSKMKTALLGVLKNELAAAKTLITNAGKGRAFLEEKLDELRDDTRGPLSKWEEDQKLIEQKRVNDINENIKGIVNLGILPPDHLSDKDYISEMIESVDNIDCSEGFDEFTQEALQAKTTAKESLSNKLNDIIQEEIKEQQRIEVEAQQKKLNDQQAEADLKAKAQERLNNLKMIPTTMFGKTSKEIEAKMNSIGGYEIQTSEFGEFYSDAIAAATQVNEQLKMMFDQQVLVESAQAQTAAQQETVKQAVDGKLDVYEQAPEVTEEKPVQARLAETFAKVEEEVKRTLFDDIDNWAIKNNLAIEAVNELRSILSAHNINGNI